MAFQAMPALCVGCRPGRRGDAFRLGSQAGRAVGDTQLTGGTVNADRDRAASPARSDTS